MNWRRSLPSGTRDKLFREANGAAIVEQKVSTVLKTRGYQRVETPIIEFADVFTDEGTTSNSLYRFFDGKGRVLVLRPDMTLPIGRVIATTGVTPPLQLFYSGKIFRSIDEMSGDQNELTQAGIELIGYPSVKAEIEGILCAYDVLTQLDIPNFHLEMGHAAIYKEILNELGLSEKEEEQFNIHLLNKSITGLKEFVSEHPSSLDHFIQALPRLFGNLDETIAKARDLISHSKILAALDELENIQQVIREYNSNMVLSADLGLVPSMSYYSGTIFRGYADRIPDYFLSGGRYDHLLEQFGDESLPAVGFAFHLDTLVSLQYHLDTIPKLDAPSTLIHYSLDALVKAEQLVKEIPDSRLSLFDDLEESKKFAKRWGYKKILFVTKQEVEILEIEEEAE